MRNFWRRYVLRVLIFSLIYFGILVYPVIRVMGLVNPGSQLGTFELLAIILLPLLGRMVYERMPNALGRWLAALALTWLGLCFQLFCLVVVFEVLNPLLAGLGWEATPVIWGWTLLTVVGLLGLGGFINAQLLTTKHISISGDRNVAGRKLVQISDVHIGSRSPALLKRIVEKTNALTPDYVLITGDLIDFAGISRTQLGPLAGFHAPCFYCIGNHERYVDLNAIDERLRSLGIRVLRNESVFDKAFQFIGIDDAEQRSQVENQLKDLPVSKKHFPVLLYHRPDGFEAAAAAGVRLMLCGHTHNGQLIPFNFLVKRVFPMICGLYANATETAQLYVSPGTGTWGPVLRIGSRSEITCFELTQAEQAHVAASAGTRL